METTLAVLSAAAAVLAVVVGPVVGLRIANRQILASVVSSNRQKWIDTLRGEVASLLGGFNRVGMLLVHASENAKKSPELQEQLQFITTTMARIELLLNPREQESVELMNAIRSAAGQLQKLFDGGIDHQTFINDSVDARNSIVPLCQRILKTEWNRVKRLE